MKPFSSPPHYNCRLRATLSQWMLLAVLILSGCAGRVQAPTDASPAPTQTPTMAPATPPATPLLRMLRFVPNTPDYQAYVTFGDAAAWHASWGIPRIADLAEFEHLDRVVRAYWMMIMPRQTVPPDTLGLQYLMADDQRGAYGFDVFNIDRFLGAGNPPEWITVAEFDLDRDKIAAALTASGYTAEELKDNGTLYSIHDDYETDLQSPTRTGMLGNLNRIAVLDEALVIAKATGNVTGALAAYNGETSSLADNLQFLAAATALNDPALADTGELVGAILMTSGTGFTDPVAMLGLDRLDEGQRAELQERLSQGPQLPFHTLVGFGTRHTTGYTSLILAVVFPPGTDAAAAAEVLAARLKNYTSLVTGNQIRERWAFDRASSMEAAGLPVALVVMRVDAPPPTPADAELVLTGVLSWAELVTRRDLGFLAAGPGPDS